MSGDQVNSRGEAALIAALLAGDQEAFRTLVSKHNDTMLRVARSMLPGKGLAEEVVQETWLAVLQGLPRFEGRSSLKTWMFRILTNRGRTRSRKEGRTIPISALNEDDSSADAFDRVGMWRRPLNRWEGTPEKGAADRELGQAIEEAVAQLPERQRQVLTYRDMKGWTSVEVCNVMEISETNQRVLLHRARTKVRLALADYLEGRR